MLSQGVSWGISQPLEMMKFGYCEHFSSSSMVAPYTLSGVPWQNCAAGSMLPKHRTSAGMCGIISAISMALPRWKPAAPVSTMLSMVLETLEPQLCTMTMNSSSWHSSTMRFT